MGAGEVRDFLTDLARERKVAAATQNQAFSALLFLYRDVLKQELPWIDDIERVKRPAKLPTVFTPQEARAVLAKLHGSARLMASLLYGCGLRVGECVRLRVKDIDFGYLHITVRDAKGGRDRITMLPVNLVESLRRQIEKRRILHEEDILGGFGNVFLPMALARKYPNAAREFIWQYVFPSRRRSVDPRGNADGKESRHHVDEGFVQLSYFPPFLCHASSRKWLRYPNSAGVVGAQGCEHHHDLHACAQQTGLRCEESARPDIRRRSGGRFQAAARGEGKHVREVWPSLLNDGKPKVRKRRDASRG